MKEKHLIELGFKKEVEDYYYYYTLNIGKQAYDSLNFCLISNASDEIVDDNWSVSIFDYDFIKFTELLDLVQFIELIKKNTHEGVLE